MFKDKTLFVYYSYTPKWIRLHWDGDRIFFRFYVDIIFLWLLTAEFAENLKYPIIERNQADLSKPLYINFFWRVYVLFSLLV